MRWTENKRAFSELIHNKMESPMLTLFTSLGDPLSVIRINDKYDTLSVLEICDSQNR